MTISGAAKPKNCHWQFSGTLWRIKKSTCLRNWLLPVGDMKNFQQHRWKLFSCLSRNFCVILNLEYDSSVFLKAVLPLLNIISAWEGISTARNFPLANLGKNIDVVSVHHRLVVNILYLRSQSAIIQYIKSNTVMKLRRHFLCWMNSSLFMSRSTYGDLAYYTKYAMTICTIFFRTQR